MRIRTMQQIIEETEAEWYSAVHRPSSAVRGVLFWSGPGLYFSYGYWGDQRADRHWDRPSLATRYNSIEAAVDSGWIVKVWR